MKERQGHKNPHMENPLGKGVKERIPRKSKQWGVGLISRIWRLLCAFLLQGLLQNLDGFLLFTKLLETGLHGLLQLQTRRSHPNRWVHTPSGGGIHQHRSPGSYRLLHRVDCFLGNLLPLSHFLSKFSQLLFMTSDSLQALLHHHFIGKLQRGHLRALLQHIPTPAK